MSQLSMQTPQLDTPDKSDLASDALNMLQAGVDEGQFRAVVALSSRNIREELICTAAGITLEQLRTVKSTKQFLKEVSINVSQSLQSRYQIDTKIDQLEDASVSSLLDTIISRPDSLETKEIIAIARMANSAIRRSDSSKNEAKSSNVINLNAMQVNNLTLPRIVLDRLSHIVKNPDIIENKRENFEDTGVTTLEQLSELLAVDIANSGRSSGQPAPEFLAIVNKEDPNLNSDPGFGEEIG